MGNTWVTDITHFLDEKGRFPAGIPAPARRIAEYFGSIIITTTARERYGGAPEVRCRRRPGRRPCPGEILAEIEPEDGAIEWFCPSCEDQGFISNWRGTRWDASGMSQERVSTLLRSHAGGTRNRQIYRFEVSLIGIEPTIWRRIEVPEGYSFWDLHVAIQDAMGWLDCHLHLFHVPDPDTGEIEPVGIPFDEPFDTPRGDSGQASCQPYFAPVSSRAW